MRDTHVSRAWNLKISCSPIKKKSKKKPVRWILIILFNSIDQNIIMSKIYININILREFMWFISHCLQNPECILHLQLTTMWTRHISCAQFLHVAHGSCVGKHSFVVKVFIVSYLFKSQVIYSKGCEVMANTLDSAPFSTIDIQVILG